MVGFITTRIEPSTQRSTTTNIKPLRTDCPITRANLLATAQKREASLLNGCVPIAVSTPWNSYVDTAVAGKKPAAEKRGGKLQPWTEGHSAEKLAHPTPYTANTGFLLGGECHLIALDIDPAKNANVAEQLAFAKLVLELIFSRPDIAPQRSKPLIRMREPASALLVLRADAPMRKMMVAGQRGQVELLTEGQQFVGDGWHPASLHGSPVQWFWHHKRAPWSVPIADLPIVPKADLERLMQMLASSGVLGPLFTRQANGHGAVARAGKPDAGGASINPATQRLRELIVSHSGRVMPAFRDLIAEAATRSLRHSAVVAITGRAVQLRWSDAEVLRRVLPLMNADFREGDWTEELRSALTHARNRERSRVAHSRQT